MTLPISLPESEFQYLDPESIIDSPDFHIVESFLKSTKRAESGGWHYIVDLTWIYSIVKDWPRTYKIIDAGGGTGPTQFMLAELGFHVTNMDLILTPPNQSIEQRYGTRLTRLPSYKISDYVQHLTGHGDMHVFTRKLRDVIKGTRLWNELSAYIYHSRHQAWRATQAAQPLGKIDWIQANLCSMPEIESASFDAVVSLSSLEHVPLNLLPSALNELGRVLKPQALMAITTSAADSKETWFHEPSKGNCFSPKDLASLFHSQNVSELSAIEILEKYRKSNYLRNNLPAFYHASGNNGMPWGEWNPSYVPVGLWR
jgi:SAM-dependent methyltransferase